VVDAYFSERRNAKAAHILPPSHVRPPTRQRRIRYGRHKRW
jgi:hypothetical protein